MTANEFQDPYRHKAEMWCDLLTAEMRWKAERDAVTVRGQLYLEAGLPPGQLLDALKITAEQWDSRVAALRAARAEASKDREARERIARAEAAEMTL